MGQAKRRGTFEQRQHEAIGKVRASEAKRLAVALCFCIAATAAYWLIVLH